MTFSRILMLFLGLILAAGEAPRMEAASGDLSSEDLALNTVAIWIDTSWIETSESRVGDSDGLPSNGSLSNSLLSMQVSVGDEELQVGVAEASTKEVLPDLLVFVDESSLTPNQRSVVFSHLLALLDDWPPGRRLALVATDGDELSVLLPWTADTSAIAEALLQASSRPAYGLELQSRLTRAAAFGRRRDHQPGSSSFSALGFIGSGQAVGVPGNPPEAQIAQRAAEFATHSAAACLIFPELLDESSERKGPSFEPETSLEATHSGEARSSLTTIQSVAMVLAGGAWDRGISSDGPVFSQPTAGLIHAAQRRGVALFPWRFEAEGSSVAPAQIDRWGTEALAEATGGVVLDGSDDSWNVLGRPGTRALIQLALPESSSASLSLVFAPVGSRSKFRAPDRWLIPDRDWQLAWRAVVGHIAGAEGNTEDLVLALGPLEAEAPDGALYQLRLEVPLEDVVLHPSGECRVGALEVRIAGADPWLPASELQAFQVEINRLGPYVAGEAEAWETMVALGPTKQRVLVSVFDPEGETMWFQNVSLLP